MKENKKYFYYLLAVLSALSLFRLFYINSINLCFDEAYNWEWAKRLSYNYYSQPGLVAWWIKFFTIFSSDSQFFVRLGAVVSSFISGILLFLLAESISGSVIVAFLTTVTFQIIPLGMIGSILIMHDSVTMPFWIASTYFLWKTVSTGKTAYWYLWALFFGFSLAGKQSSFLMMLCVGVLLLSNKENRRMFFSKDFYLSLFIPLAFLSANFYWNYTHDFVNYKHVFKHASNFVVKPFEGTAEFLGSQLLLVSPVFFVLILITAVYFLIKYFKTSTKRESFIFAMLIFPLFLFLVQSVRSKVEGNWPNILYPVGLTAMYIYLKEVTWKPLTKIINISTGFIFALFISLLILFPSNIMLLGIKVKPQDDRSNEVAGWDTVGTQLGAVLKELPADTFLFGINYQTPAIVRFYTAGHPQVYCFPYRYRKGNQYDIWDNWDTLEGRNGLLIIFEPMAEDLKEDLNRSFKSVKLYRTIDIYRKEYKDTPIRNVNLYLCTGLKSREFISKPVWY